MTNEEVARLIVSALTGEPISGCQDNGTPTVVEAVEAVLSRSQGCWLPTATATPSPTPLSIACAQRGGPTPTVRAPSQCAPAFPEHPNVLWLEDDGTLTHEEAYLLKDGIKARLDSVCSSRPFDLASVSTSNFDGRVLGSNGGGIAQYLSTCDTEKSGLAHRALDYHPCSPDDSLQGFMALTNLDYWRGVSDEERRMTSLHELGHRWGALAYTSTPGAMIGIQHWRCRGLATNTDCFEIDSIMSEREGEGFAWLDLYLMGMASPSEVPAYDYVAADGNRIPVTIESIIEATGSRVPALPDAPTHFRLAWVVVTPQGRTPDPCELDVVEHWSEAFPAWWSTATHGRSSVEVGFPVAAQE